MKQLTIAQLAAESGVPSRTIRSWVAEQLVPGPLARGRGATYPAEALDRVLRVRQMREAGLSADDIRRHDSFGLADPVQLLITSAQTSYPSARRMHSMSDSPIPEMPSGFSVLATRLGVGNEYDPAVGARTTDWVAFEVSPDVALNVRGPLSEKQRALIGRCAMEIGRILVSSV